MIYSNSDISLTLNFYAKVVRKIQRRQCDSMSICRRTIPKKYPIKKAALNVPPNKIGQLFASHDIPYINKNIVELTIGYHPGDDCFVIHRDIIESLHLGNMFLGFIPWDSTFVGT